MLPSPIGAYFDFLTPVSGLPDLVIEPLTLSPDSGQTFVGITVRNRGFASAPSTHSLFETTDHSSAGPYTTEHIILENSLGPRTSRPRNLKWVPNSIQDTVAYTADDDELLDELREDNNVANDVISRVDATAPFLTLSLLNASIDQNQAADVFGRYISKVPGVTSDVEIDVTDTRLLQDGRLDPVAQPGICRADWSVFLGNAVARCLAQFRLWVAPPHG